MFSQIVGGEKDGGKNRACAQAQDRERACVIVFGAKHNLSYTEAYTCKNSKIHTSTHFSSAITVSHSKRGNGWGKKNRRSV